jgi:hypothetical protein
MDAHGASEDGRSRRSAPGDSPQKPSAVLPNPTFFLPAYEGQPLAMGLRLERSSDSGTSTQRSCSGAGGQVEEDSAYG